MPAFGLATGTKVPRIQARKPLHVCNAFALKPAGGSSAPITLNAGTVSVGANQSADIVIDIETVSGSHAQLQIEESAVTVTDLGSTNGTYVDGVKIEAKKAVSVKNGSKLAFGEGEGASFTLVEEAAAEEAAAETEAATVTETLNA